MLDVIHPSFPHHPRLWRVKFFIWNVGPRRLLAENLFEIRMTCNLQIVAFDIKYTICYCRKSYAEFILTEKMDDFVQFTWMDPCTLSVDDENRDRNDQNYIATLAAEAHAQCWNNYKHDAADWTNTFTTLERRIVHAVNVDMEKRWWSISCLDSGITNRKGVR